MRHSDLWWDIFNALWSIIGLLGGHDNPLYRYANWLVFAVCIAHIGVKCRARRASASRDRSWHHSNIDDAR